MKELPFTLTPNTDFFVNLTGHQETLQQLQAHLEKDEGFLSITGPSGSGKTLLCKQLVKSLPESFETAYIPNPFFSPEGLIQIIANELGIDADVDQGYYYVQNLIRIRLKAIKKQKRRTVLLLDEAQAMPEATVKALVTMAYLEQEDEKLLQVILAGQPELEDILEQDYLESIRQRITFTCTLPPLSSEQITIYINQRVNRAGRAGGNLFTPEALNLIARFASGIPRHVNILCHDSLMIAYINGRDRVTDKEVRLAQSESAIFQSRNLFSLLFAYRQLIFSGILVTGVIVLSGLYLLG